VIEELEPDDRAALLDELPVEVAAPLIARLSPENRAITQTILGYDSESVGRLMTPDYVRIRKDWTVGDALSHIRRYGQDAETVHWIFVIDDEGTLIDDLHIRSLLLADPDSIIADLMDHHFVTLGATDDREEAVRAMARYNRTALPVVDSLGLLIGIVTADDIADVAEEEFTEDVQKLGGMEALHAPYTTSPIRDMVRKRGSWLTGLFILQLLSIGVIGLFDHQLEQAMVLALFIPLIIASGGNTGTQAASLLVRAIAVEEVHLGLWWRIIKKELLTGLILGTVLGFMGVLTVVLLSMVGFAHTPHALPLALTVGSAIFFIVIWGTLIGSMLPLILHKLGLDPAASSAPLVATLMDASGLTIYFGLATFILRGSLL
ncbi:MAG: magnesium transporter, partial [Phycisphaerales bacterium]|nr:magnesium transporter [Phycisphaerales bacterium]